MDNGLRWDQVRYFLAVARAGSAVAAAQLLGVSHATVMRNIAQLEQSLGIRLFDHVRTGYRITGDGEDVLGSARAMEEHAETLVRQAMGRNPSPTGRLKLSICDSALFDSLQFLSEFRRAHPRIELVIENDQAALARLSQHHVDAAIFVGNAPPEELIGRQLTRLRLRWFAAAGPARRTTPAAEDCDWILWTIPGSAELDDSWHRAQLRRLTPRPRIVLQADTHHHALAAVRAGLGVALLNEAVSDGLRRLPFAEPSETFGVWLLTHPDLRRSGRVRALFDFVAGQTRPAQNREE
jgi:DNA-binding transcriptional LysR family regulator